MIPRRLSAVIRGEEGIERLRELGPGAEVLVRAGERVRPDTVVGATKSGTRVVRLPLEGEETAAMMVLKRPGESLRRGEPLLQRPSWLGLACTEYVSPVDGYVEEILLAQRAVLIREHTAQVSAGVEGVVLDVLPDRGVLLRFDGTVIRFFAGWGPPVAGELAAGAELLAPADAARAVRDEHRGKILWAYSRISAEAILEAVRVGAAGLIGGSVGASELSGAMAQIRRRTGRERIPLTLLISEGFGSAPMSLEVRRSLASAVGHTVYLDAGGPGGLEWTRDPEVTFSSPVCGGAAPAGPAGGPSGPGQPEPTAQWLAAPPARGELVRVIDVENFGAVGRIVSEVSTVPLATGVTCPVVAVELGDGTRVKVPVISVERLDAPPASGR
ncbi:MAG: hypothetical protein Q8P31_11325 [Bacillota bacterium]|nr:hypothetical protein [Bacillota bacterium]